MADFLKKVDFFYALEDFLKQVPEFFLGVTKAAVEHRAKASAVDVVLIRFSKEKYFAF
jgi:hypothetical protein